VSGNGYFVNTTSTAITVTLPAGSAGDIVSLADYAATWQTNNLTVSPNGSDNIGGVNVDVTLNTEGQSVTFVYTDSTQGWINTMDSTSNVRGTSFITATGGTITTCGNYKIHTFTSPGTFTVTATGSGTPCAPSDVDYLVVAGGGGSGGNLIHIAGGGGGGAGGYRESSGTASGCYTASPLGACVSALPVTATDYPITVGAGGSGGGVAPSGTYPCGPGASATAGSNSVFSTITSAGGGNGGQPSTGGGSGGSGGGGGGGLGGGSAGTGNTPPTSPPQGNNGGAGAGAPYCLGGSGGGATGTGSTSPASQYTPSVNSGGAGATTSISGSSTTYSIGGTYSSYFCGARQPSCAGAANSGDGGDAKNAGPTPLNPFSPPANADANYAGLGGGSGVVIIRYKYQ